MDINASTASQAYAAAKPAAAGTQGAAQSGQTLPVSQTTQTRQVTVDATSSSPAFVLDISTQVLKVEKLSDMSAEDQQYWLDQRQQFIDRFEAFGRSTGKEGLGSALAGKDITFGQEDGTSKILRADGYVVTTRDNLTAGQLSALTRHYAEVDADHAAEISTGATNGSQNETPAAVPTPTATQPLTPHVLKVEAFADLSAEDRQELVRLKQELIDHWTEIARSHGNEPDFSGLEGKDINFSWGDGTIKTWRADGSVATSRYDAQQEQELQDRIAADAAKYSTGTPASGASATTANATVAVPSAATPTPSSTETPPSATEAASPYAKMQGYTEVKLSDLSAEDQQSLLKLRKDMQESYASRGRTLTANVSYTSQSGLRTILTPDDRVITYQQDTSHRLTPEQIAQRQAADEQNRRETEAQMAAQAEWEKKWGVGAKVSSDKQMSAGELAVAEDVALTEHMLNTFRMDISTVNGLNWNISNYQKQLDEGGVDLQSSTAAKLRERMDAAKAEVDKLVARLARKQDVFQSSFGYDLVGNMFEQTADGRYREGTYTLIKGTGSNGAIKVDSAEGIMVSANGGAFTYDFHRVVAANPGPSPILLESPEERARRVQSP